jgi:hypothetical protein
MKHTANIAITVACFLCATVLPATQPIPKTVSYISKPVREIVDQFIQASGGSGLQQVMTEKRSGILIRGISGAVPFETTATASGKWLYHQVFAYGDQVTYGCDGAQSWVQDAQAVRPLPAEERLELAMLLDPRMPSKLVEIFPEMELKGEEKIGQKGAVLISATSAEGVHLELAFDRASGLLVQAGDLFFEDYRNVKNVMRPHTVWLGADLGQDSLRLKMQVTAIQQNADVDESVFSRPACTLAIAPPVLYKLRNEIPVSSEARQACVGVYQAEDDANVYYTVTLQGEHLMLERTGMGTSLEILAESETDYFMRFLNLEFHFIKDSTGRITGLERGPDRDKKAKKIK